MITLLPTRIMPGSGVNVGSWHESPGIRDALALHLRGGGADRQRQASELLHRRETLLHGGLSVLLFARRANELAKAHASASERTSAMETANRRSSG